MDAKDEAGNGFFVGRIFVDPSSDFFPNTLTAATNTCFFIEINLSSEFGSLLGTTDVEGQRRGCKFTE